MLDRLNIRDYSRAHVIEQIMHLIAGIESPIIYRAWLEAQGDETLSEHLRIITEEITA